MNIIYAITILVIYILFMLLHKSEKKQNLIAWLAISAIMVLCYNILICLICTFIGVLCTLGNLSICNIITIMILLTILFKSKKIQKFYTKVSDLIYSILLLILVIFIAYKQYGSPFNIKYYITDGSTHYFFAQQFYENSTLLYNEITDDFLGMYSSSFRLPGAYINEGILFKVFDNIILKTDIFILFDLFILYLSGILFFYLLNTYARENKKLYVLAMIFAIIYMLGYQLNSMLYGYVYLSLALVMIISFLLVISNYEKEEISNKIALPILSLLSFGIFFSYAYFIPIIYVGIIINIIIKSIKNKQKIFSSKNVILLIYLIIIPAILGLSYFIIFPLVSKMKTEISSIGVDGGIYENYITNYLPFIIIFTISIIFSIKNKDKCEKNNYSTVYLVLSIIFAIILFIGKKLGIVSTYYFFKAYYIIWLFSIYNFYIAISYILTNKNKILKIFTYIYVIIYMIMIIISTIVLKKNIWINDIFLNNIENINSEYISLKNGEVALAYKTENHIENNQIYILAPEEQGRALWMSVLFHNQFLYIDWKTGYSINIERWLSEKEEKYYLAYHRDYRIIENDVEYLNEESSEYKIIYNDEYGFILERK